MNGGSSIGMSDKKKDLEYFGFGEPEQIETDYYPYQVASWYLFHSSKFGRLKQQYIILSKQYMLS